MKAMSFRQWLKKNHNKDKDRRLNDLWDDAKDDDMFPWLSSFKKQLEYLMSRTDDYDVYDTLTSAWHSYIEYLLAVASDEEVS